MVWYDDPVIVTVVLLVIIIACASVIFAMRRQGKKPKPKKRPDPAIDLEFTSTSVPFKISKSVQTPMASSAKDELRTLDLEREILGDAIRRLYEACAEGKISEDERERLASYYKIRMNLIKESISKDENIIALHELEGMQEDLMKLFSERFGELSTKVEMLRTKIDVKPIREIPIKLPARMPTQIENPDEDQEPEGEPETNEGEDRPKRKPKKLPEEKPESKNEAERRIETIQSEVEKILDRLGQMEVEG